MIKIYYNTKSHNNNVKLKLTFANTYIRADVEDGRDGKTGFDIIRRMAAYNSYSLVDTKGKVKIYRQSYDTDFKFLNLNRLGMSSRMEFDEIEQLYGTRTMAFIDTGVMSDTVRDINVYLFRFGNPENIEVFADQECELIPFDGDEYKLNNPMRFNFWDGYSLCANGREVIMNHRGEVVMGDVETPFESKDGVIEFTIQKYKGGYNDGILVRDIDCEEVHVETSAGLADNRRVRLVNGVGKFRLITFGYEGYIKIKLGRKWFSGWNDYALNVK